jgi:hypothetical protein
MCRHDLRIDRLMRHAKSGNLRGKLGAARELLLTWLDVYRCG